MEFNNILKLIERVSDSELSRFVLEEGDTKITLEAASRGGMLSTQELSAQNEVSTADMNTPEIKAGTKAGTKAEVNAAINEKNPAKDGDSTLSAGNIVKSPLVGVFYNSASPEAKSFVQVGDKVSKGQILGIVEAMKLMNEIESDFEGVVKEILVDNEAVVEYGQPLFVIA